MKNKNFRNFESIARFQAGIVLNGSEAKSLYTKNSCDINSAYGLFSYDDLYIHGMVIPKYEKDFSTYVEDKERKLLLSRKELTAIKMLVKQGGYSIIASDVYKNKHGKYKIDIHVCEKIKSWDKRDKISKRISNEEMKDDFNQ